MAAKAAKICGLKEKIYRSIKKIDEVNGRLELVKKFPNQVKVYIDYAHTPDALKKAIEALQNNFGKNISVVFGCGGNRDKKRPIMAKIANDNCKKIYVTDDNPRDESPQKIRGDIIKHFQMRKAIILAIDL